MTAPSAVPGRVDVVIVTFNSERHLDACIAAVRAWDRVGQVVVVDNASQDRSADVASSAAEMVVRMTANVGFGAAQNRGRAETLAPFVLILNPDARVDVAGLEAGLQVMAGSPDVGLVEGAVLRARDGAEERWQGRAPGLADLVARLFRLRQWLGEERLKRLAAGLGVSYFADRRPKKERDVEFLAAVAVLARRQALEDVGGFDETYFLYAEDTDLCARLRSAGWRLVAIPDRWASHVGGASSSGAEAMQRRRWWESHALFVRRHWSGPRRWAGMLVTSAGLTVEWALERRGSWISRPV